MIKYLSALIAAMLIIACNTLHNKRGGNKIKKTIDLPYFVDIENKFSENKSIPLSSIGKHLDYIPLETNPNSMLERIAHISFSEDFMFIADFDRILQFDRKGKFLRQIGANGRGPGEYAGIASFCIDQKNRKVFVNSCSDGCKIFEYDFNGSFIRSFNQPFMSSQFIVYDTTGFIFYLAHDNDTTVYSKYNFYITDYELNPNYKIKRHFIRKSNIGGREIPLYYYNGKLRFKQYTVDTLYTLENEKQTPYAIFNLGKTKLDPNYSFNYSNPNVAEMMKEMERFIEISDIAENDNYLFTKIDYGLTDSSKYCICNKQTAETTMIGEKGFKNDIDGGLQFWPRYIYNDNTMVDYVDALRFLSMLKKRENNNRSDQLEILEKNLTETSNPIIIVLK
jgi:hypothetical protein